MSQEEVEEWLDHVPVFAVTDSKGQGVVLKPDDDTSVFYFFMSPLMANATLTQLKESSNGEDMDFRVSAFSLGKIWFKMINADTDTEVKVGNNTVQPLLRTCCFSCCHRRPFLLFLLFLFSSL